MPKWHFSISIRAIDDRKIKHFYAAMIKHNDIFLTNRETLTLFLYPQLISDHQPRGCMVWIDEEMIKKSAFTLDSSINSFLHTELKTKNCCRRKNAVMLQIGGVMKLPISEKYAGL